MGQNKEETEIKLVFDPSPDPSFHDKYTRQ